MNRESFDVITSRLQALTNTTYKKADIVAACDGIENRHVQRFIYREMVRVKTGVYTLSEDLPVSHKQQPEPVVNTIETNQPDAVSDAVTASLPQLQTYIDDSVYVPTTDSLYVPWGHSKAVNDIVKSNMFFPTYINGMSGNGKTMMVEQACAKAKRQYLRVQITPETDEDDLIGGFRLINGDTVFAEGPVIKAMRKGAVLLIDEIDRGSNKIMCLQGIMEGKPVLIKKTGETVAPADGFQIIASANSKGRGSDDGRYASSIIDDAFLERFIVTMDQPYPSKQVEKKILLAHGELYGVNDSEFFEKLVMWAQAIRKTFFDTDGAGIGDLITTRRLCHIIKTYSIFNDRKKSVELCVNRFDNDVKDAFIDLYGKIDAEAITEETKNIFGSDPFTVTAPQF
jgi:hypothetical protein